MVPAFHELGDDLFEDLCREVTQEEDDVATVERYGTSGQRQLGIDLLIEYKDDSLAAGQCVDGESKNAVTDATPTGVTNRVSIGSGRAVELGETPPILQNR